MRPAGTRVQRTLLWPFSGRWRGKSPRYNHMELRGGHGLTPEIPFMNCIFSAIRQVTSFRVHVGPLRGSWGASRDASRSDLPKANLGLVFFLVSQKGSPAFRRSCLRLATFALSLFAWQNAAGFPEWPFSADRRASGTPSTSGGAAARPTLGSRYLDLYDAPWRRSEKSDFPFQSPRRDLGAWEPGSLSLGLIFSFFGVAPPPLFWWL